MLELTKTIEVEVVRYHREEDCEYYGGCLYTASRMQWKSFSCQGCSDYAKCDKQVAYMTCEDTGAMPDSMANASLTGKERIKLTQKMKDLRFAEYDFNFLSQW